MFNLPLELTIDIIILCNTNNLINFSLINKNTYNLFILNKNYIGKGLELLHDSFIKIYNRLLL